jgi:hypothetical protein
MALIYSLPCPISTFVSLVENNPKYLLSPPWERIEVRGQRL